MLVRGLDDSLNEAELFVRSHCRDTLSQIVRLYCRLCERRLSIANGVQVGSAHWKEDVRRVEVPVEKGQANEGALPQSTLLAD